LFQTGLDPNTRSAEDWALTNNSSYKSSGIQSGVAGFRTHGLIWDDLTKNRKEADSQTIRDDVHNAYIDDARSRKTPNAWEVGIGTRWHEDEIMGRILPEGYAGESGFMRCRDGNIWYVICMAAECERDDDPLGREPGEMLWPEWFDEGYWAEKRMNPRSWGSLYQQRPAPEEGIVFKKEWMKWYETAPKDLSKYISFDPGVSDHGDETSILIWGVDEENRVYLLDEWYRKCTMDVWIEQLITLVKIHNPIKVISESGVIRRASEPFLARAMRNTGCFFACEWVTRSSNKEAMAAPAIGLCAQGMVYLPKNSVGENLLRDLLAFPASKQDHRPDAFANFGLHLQSIFAAQPVKAVKRDISVLESGEIPIKALMPPRYSKKRSRWTLN
jgi:predicted phage terminase large subunit-like protein